jgi:deoxyribonuclease IV
MFGSHLSIAGSMANALREAESFGMDTVQVFTKNQQQWAAKPLAPEAIAEWQTELNRLGWQGRIVSHASYLINLASNNDELYRKSIDLMTDEIERCEALGISFLVHHPGSFTGHTLEAGLRRIADAYRELFKRTAGYKTISCFEGTVGSGSLIGGPFEHLRELRALAIESTAQPNRLGFCLDTCHLHAAGHDLSTQASAQSVFKRFDELCGLANVRCLHINDSKAPMASKRDLHQHIGQGTIGSPNLPASGFHTVMNLPVFSNIPKILETPKGNDPTGQAWDLVNLAALKSLLPGARPLAPMALAPKPARTQPSRPTKQHPVKPAAKPKANAGKKSAKMSSAKPTRKAPLSPTPKTASKDTPKRAATESTRQARKPKH